MAFLLFSLCFLLFVFVLCSIVLFAFLLLSLGFVIVLSMRLACFHGFVDDVSLMFHCFGYCVGLFFIVLSMGLAPFLIVLSIVLAWVCSLVLFTLVLLLVWLVFH